MPNWCQNVVYIDHDDKEKLNQIEEYLSKDDEDGFFNLLVPYPGEWDYDWSVSNWGTKWNGDIYDIKLNEGELVIGFCSAWSPPTYWLQKVARIFPDLHFELTYMETGIWFAGLCMAEGDYFEDLEREISQTDEEQREVKYDSRKERYVYADDGEVIEDEDFTPIYSVI